MALMTRRPRLRPFAAISSVPSPVRRMAAGFLGVLLVAEIAVRMLGAVLPEPRDWYHDIAQAKAEQLEQMKGSELDMVFAGTSQTYYAIGPRAIDGTLGTKSYNAAIPAGVPPLQERWLLNQVLGRVDTDVVVWGMSVLDLNDGRDLTVVDSYTSAPATRRGVLAEIDRRLASQVGLFRYRRQLFDPDAWADRTKMDAIRSIIRPDGQRQPADRAPSQEERRRIRKQVVADYQTGGRMVASARRTIEALKDRGIEVVVVWLPVPERLLDLLPDSRLEHEARQQARHLADVFALPFLDVSEGFTNDDFLDYTHLGEHAAERLTQQLSAKLVRLRGAPDSPSRQLGAWPDEAGPQTSRGESTTNT